LKNTPVHAGSGFATDVFIVGGGPAGLAAAIAARRRGFHVTVADGAAPPIEKTCGEGLMPETLSALAVLGVEFSRDEGRVFRGISFVGDDVKVCADFPQASGLGVKRPLLQERLAARAAACGVNLLWRTPVTGIAAGQVQLQGEQIRARWIVGADGQGSRVRRWSGLESPALTTTLRFANRCRYRMAPWSDYVEIHWGRHVQAYVTPIGPDEVCVATMADTVECAAFDAALDELPQLRKRLRGATASSRMRGAVSAMRSLERVQRNNVALLGDASGGADAITGDGLRLAFRQSVALAEALAAGDLTLYQRSHRHMARRTRMVGSLMLQLGRRPRLRRRVFCVLRNSPDLFARLLATHASDASSKQLLSTGAVFGLRFLTASCSSMNMEP
jgi:2-polyprenyl-6-methoxyphenol hydroxylase-like FAD-dependent oxidoreductase